jgi:hypothetical protein
MRVACSSIIHESANLLNIYHHKPSVKSNTSQHVSLFAAKALVPASHNFQFDFFCGCFTAPHRYKTIRPLQGYDKRQK